MLGCTPPLAFFIVAYAILAMVPVSLGALTTAVRFRGCESRSLAFIGALSIVLGFLELAVGVRLLSVGVIGVGQIVIGGLILALNDPQRRTRPPVA